MMILTNKMNLQCQLLIWVNKPPGHEKLQPAVLEIPASIHCPFCPNMVDFSECVPRAPGLQKDWSKYFHFDEFACSGSSFTQINHPHCRFILFVEIIIAIRGVVSWQWYVLGIEFFFQLWKLLDFVLALFWNFSSHCGGQQMNGCVRLTAL